MSKGKILLVDDLYTNQILILTLLQDEGYEVSAVGNGQEAIDTIQKQSPDLLILDLMMPVMDGFTLLKKLKGEVKFPIIILTARSDYESLEKAFELGAVDYIIKPFNLNDLINKVNRNLGVLRK